MANQTTIHNTKVHIGDLIDVHQKVQEKDKTRTQIFSGILIAIKNKDVGQTFTVRKLSGANVAVERIWPVNSPWIQKVKIKRKGKVRRAKLYYLRKKLGAKTLRLKEKKTTPVKQKKATKRPPSKKKSSTKKKNK